MNEVSILINFPWDYAGRALRNEAFLYIGGFGPDEKPICLVTHDFAVGPRQSTEQSYFIVVFVLLWNVLTDDGTVIVLFYVDLLH